MVRTQVRHATRRITITYPRFSFDGISGGDGDGGYVCFLCDRTMETGEAFICVSRLLETCEGSEVKPRVIEAVASLQVCLPCTLLSAHHRLKWTHNPEVTGFEIRTFYTYVRLLAETISRRTSDTRTKQEELIGHLVGGTPHLPVEMDRAALLGGAHDGSPVGIVTEDQCHRCHNTIEFSKPHVMFEISIDVSRRDGMTKSNIWRLGGYCHGCSKRFLPVCDRLW